MQYSGGTQPWEWPPQSEGGPQYGRFDSFSSSGYPSQWVPEDTEVPPLPAGQDGFLRLSQRIFVVPMGTSTVAAVEELNEVYSQGVSEKAQLLLDLSSWVDEAECASSINKAFRVKGSKAPAKFWSERCTFTLACISLPASHRLRVH